LLELRGKGLETGKCPILSVKRCDDGARALLLALFCGASHGLVIQLSAGVGRLERQLSFGGSEQTNETCTQQDEG
jgi:hypothetical protein